MPFQASSRETHWDIPSSESGSPGRTTSGPQTPVASRPVNREVTCFTCHQKGHKSPQCPQKQNQVRRVQILSNKIVALRDKELFGSVCKHCMPITCDSGANITVVPEECVEGDQFTGGTCEVDSFNKFRSTGKLCNVVVSIAGRQFYRKAVTQPGKDLTWTICLSVPYSNKGEREFISGQMDAKFALREEETCYLPAEMKNGILTSRLMVSEGTLIPADKDMGGAISEPRKVESQTSLEGVEKVSGAEVVELRESEELALETVAEPSVSVEEGGDWMEGRAVGEVEQVVSFEGIAMEVPRPKLAKATEDDPTLATARSLAMSKMEGYHYLDGIVFRTRLDPLETHANSCVSHSRTELSV